MKDATLNCSSKEDRREKRDERDKHDRDDRDEGGNGPVPEMTCSERSDQQQFVRCEIRRARSEAGLALHLLK